MHPQAPYPILSLVLCCKYTQCCLTHRQQLHSFLCPDIGANIRRVYNRAWNSGQQWADRKDRRGYSRPEQEPVCKVAHGVSKATVRRPTQLAWRILSEKQRETENSGGSWLISSCLNAMLNGKPLLVLDRWPDIMEAVSQEYESGIDAPETCRGRPWRSLLCAPGVKGKRPQLFSLMTSSYTGDKALVEGVFFLI